MEFISCDWGTTNFRLRWIGGLVAKERQTDDGANKLSARGGDRGGLFQATLEHHLRDWKVPRELPVVISGMASSSIGWRELPYAPLPFSLEGQDVGWLALDDRTFLISGIRSATDILRGEETQALGLAASLGRTDLEQAIFLFPGTHSKHLTISKGAVTDLKTYMTGELFELLSRQSVLRHSIELAAEFDREAFVEGVLISERTPLAQAIFRVRTRQVLHQASKSSNRSYLSGLLIGAELNTIVTHSAAIHVAASGQVAEGYALAAATLGFGSRWRSHDSEPLVSAGQELLLKRLLPNVCTADGC